MIKKFNQDVVSILREFNLKHRNKSQYSADDINLYTKARRELLFAKNREEAQSLLDKWCEGREENDFTKLLRDLLDAQFGQEIS